MKSNLFIRRKKKIYLPAGLSIRDVTRYFYLPEMVFGTS
jgi:hypothetical protein